MNTVDFETTSKLCGLIAKEYAEAFFSLLVTYKNISASEAASRLDIHIKTAQDFLEGLEQLGICAKQEVLEQKRPYFRYTLDETEINIKLNLSQLSKEEKISDILKWQIRERKHSGAMFKTSRGGSQISYIHFFVGEGRKQEERKLNLTTAQGQFLYHLPFPTEPYLLVEEIIKKAGIDSSFISEILDIVRTLTESKIIDKK